MATTTTTTTTTTGGVTTTTTVTTTTASASVELAFAPTEPKWPRRLDEISVEWLSQVSGAKVASFDAHKLDGGALSDASILTLQYEGPPGKMNSLVLKYAKELDLGREMAVKAGAYEKECNFFEFLAPKAPVRVPEVYGVWRDEVNPETWFLIAMEDLSVENEVLPGAPGLDWATTQKVVQIAAKMHAAYYQHEALSEKWLTAKVDSIPDDLYATFWMAWAQPAYDDLEGKIQAAREGLGAHPRGFRYYGPDYYPEYLEILHLMAGPQGKALQKALRETLTSRPKTLCHGDLRADNIFRPKKQQQGDAEFPLIDWQMISAGPGATDLVQAVWMAFTDLEDYKRIGDMVQYYHSELASFNPEYALVYTVEMASEDYKIALAFAASGMCAVMGDYTKAIADSPENGLWDVIGTMVPRNGACCTEMKVLAYLKERLAALPAEEGVPPS